MLYINMASMRLLEFNYGFIRFIETREKKQIVKTQNPGWHLVYNYKSHICSKKKKKRRKKRKHHKKHFQRWTRFEPWTEERKKRTLTWIMNNARAVLLRGFAGNVWNIKRHCCTLSVCWPSSCRPICPPDLRLRFGLSCGWNSPQMTAHLEDNGRQNTSQISGRISTLLHPQADMHICYLMTRH